jgi:predicted acylesterase/phospholipase RssA
MSVCRPIVLVLHEEVNVGRAAVAGRSAWWHDHTPPREGAGMSVEEKLRPKKQRKLLALDGGGIRGLMTVEVLAAIEDTLRQGRGEDFRLADEFDYVGGTSTGAIIATCVSLGMSVAEIRSFYLDSGREMFDKARLLRRFRTKYEDEQLAKRLKEVIGADTTLGSDALRTLLLIVMRNATTDSPWPLSNNPGATFNRPERRAEGQACNLDLPLWQLVRASTAAPTYFPPEAIDAGGPGPFLMVDGGVTMYNNPAFLMFLMATVEPYRLCWPSGVDEMLVVSVGTGTSPKANQDLAPEDMNLLYNAGSVPSALMYGALNEQDMLCRVFGDCRYGAPLDLELGDLVGVRGPAEPKLFSYVRYNAELTQEWLAGQGLSHVRPRDVQPLDSTEHMAELQEVGRAVARQVVPEHFAGF